MENEVLSDNSDLSVHSDLASLRRLKPLRSWSKLVSLYSSPQVKLYWNIVSYFPLPLPVRGGAGDRLPGPALFLGAAALYLAALSGVRGGQTGERVHLGHRRCGKY